MTDPSRRLALLGSLGLVAGCSMPNLGGDPSDYASLPPDAIIGAGDPVRSAVVNVTTAFSDPAVLRNRPADAARAIAQMEYLTVELNHGARWSGVTTFSPLSARARAEWRGVLGIAPDAQPQAVIDSLYGAARAMSYGQRDQAAAVLSPPLFREGAATLTRLASLPPLPATNAAAAEAANTVRRSFGGGKGAS